MDTIKFDPSKKIHEQITEETWCKGVMYRDENGRECDTSKTACKACLVGWLNIADKRDKLITTAISREIGTYEKDSIYYMIGSWNDRESTIFENVHTILKKLDI